MKSMLPRLVGALLLVGVTAGIACSDEGTVDQDKARDQANQASQTIQKETRDAWATLRTDGDKLVDQIQTRNDPEAKKQLVDQCRSTVEQMRKNDAPNADRVNTFCDQVRDTDTNNNDAWNKVKTELKDLNTRFGG